MRIRPITLAWGLTASVLGAAALGAGPSAVVSPSAAGGDTSLSDAQIANIAVTADDIDIAYAHLALALSSNPKVRQFAETMIADHSSVNAKAAALAKKLGITPEASDVSRQLQAQAAAKVDELTTLRGAEFDRAYARSELAYHKAVNAAVRDTLIPGTSNVELRMLLESAVPVFLMHEQHAEALNEAVGGSGTR